MYKDFQVFYTRINEDKQGWSFSWTDPQVSIHGVECCGEVYEGQI